MKKVTHSIFGQGQVISFDSKTVTIDFNGNVKTLAIKFANLLNEDGTIAKFSIAKNTSKKEDFSMYSDSQLKAIYEKEKDAFVGAINDANADAKEDRRKGFGQIN
jgi:hypothetical protein